MSSVRGAVGLAARICAGLFLVVAGFQAALAVGAPWGEAAWGGAHAGSLPTGYRLGSAAAAIVWLVLAAALGTAWLGNPGRRRLLTGLLVLMALSALMNAASRSPLERAVWVPFAVVQIALLWVARRQEAVT